MLEITGFQIQSKLFESTGTTIYRGRRQSDQAPVIIKTLSSSQPSLPSIAQLYQEIKILQVIEGAEGPSTYQLMFENNNPFLVIPDFGGKSLDIVLRERKFELAELLRMMVKLAEQLSDIHQKHVIHKDINLSNIVFNEESQQVQFIDFGISTVLPREATSYLPPEKLEGTLHYIAPEQTGRMNQTIDYRSDYYSLGICFYELLSGIRPFKSDDPLELIHCHIAKSPIPLSEVNPGIGASLEAIVAKLMAKSKGDRYKSASGLRHDLSRCLDDLESTGSITPFKLGETDHSSVLQIPEKLIGRHHEVQQLLDVYAQVAGGKSALMLISGYSGIGKSTLVHEIQKPITESRGLFASGKFDQHQRNIPYSALIEAFRDLVNQCLTQSEKQIEAWKSRLTAALYPNAQVILDVIPELEIIIGEQPAVAPVQPTEALNRFDVCFRSFVDVFASEEHPLGLFLDDLQWADNASLRIMKSLVIDQSSQYLMLMSAYRDNEVNDAHPLMLTLAACKEQKAAVSSIFLKDLNLEDINQLVRESLFLSEAEAAPLAEVVITKTGGNPFFAKEFLIYLYQKRLLVFNVKSNQWEANLQQIQLQKSTDNIAELMAEKILDLPEHTNELLKYAACLGSRFSLGTLALVLEKSHSDVLKDLWPAIQIELIIPESEAYQLVMLERDIKLSSEQSEIIFFFQHDQVQQASAAMLTKEENKKVHLKLGRHLLASLGKGEERLLEIVSHLNFGESLIEDLEEKFQLGQLNFKAGLKTKTSSAYQSALTHFTTAIALTEESLWEQDRETAFLMHKERIECEYLVGNFEAAEQEVQSLMDRALDTPELVQIALMRTTYNTMVGRFVEAIEIGINGLKLFGIEMNPVPSDPDFGAEMAQIQSNMEGKEISDLTQLPPNQDPSTLFPLIQLALMFAPTYITGNVPLMSLVIMKMTAIASKHGDFNGVAFASQGLLEGAQQNFKEGYEYTLAASKMSPHAVLPFFVMGAFVGPWRISFKECQEFLNQGYINGLNSGDLTYARYASQFIPSYSFLRGEPLSKVLATNKKFFGFNEESGDPMGYAIMSLMPHVCAQLSGQPNPIESSVFDAKEGLAETFPIIHAQYFIYQGQSQYIFEDYTGAYQSLMESMKTTGAVVGHGVLSVRAFYLALVALKLSEQAEGQELESLKQTISENCTQMALWAENSPENFLHKHQLLEAENECIAGNPDKALPLFEKAITQAKEVENIGDVALAYELAAKCYLKMKVHSVSNLCLTNASYWYMRWGATKKTHQLAERYEYSFSKGTDFESLGSSNTKRTRGTIQGSYRSEIDTSQGTLDGVEEQSSLVYRTGSSIGSLGFSASVLDLESMIKTTRIINKHIELNALLSSMLELILQNTGAQRGVLIVAEDSGLKVMAQLDIETKEMELLDQPLGDFNELCHPIVNLVYQFKKPTVVVDALQESRFRQDHYVQKTEQHSLLCCPMMVHRHLIGLIYLENRSVPGAFTEERAEFLRMFATQMGMALDHAKLFAQVQEHREQLEQKVKKRTQELQDANETKDKFFSIIAHDLRGPIGSLATVFSDIVTDQEPMEAALLAAIRESTTNTHNLLENLLTWARSQKGQIEKNPSHFSVNMAVQHTIQLLQASALKKGISLIGKLDSGFIGYADEPMIKTVIRNLVNNGIKFSRNGDSITVKVEEKGEFLEVSVTDTGRGMSDKKQSALFNIAKINHSSPGTDNEKGTGLGLVLCREFISANNGTIGVESELNKGSRFFFTLPKGNVERQLNERRLKENGKALCCLLIDDNTLNLKTNHSILSGLGLNVDNAANCDEDLTQVNEKDYDLILVDLEIPNLDGLAKAIQRSRMAGRKAPHVIALTSHSKAELVEIAGLRPTLQDINFTDYLSKPLNPEEALRVISRIATKT